jgi:hypothetical protein
MRRDRHPRQFINATLEHPPMIPLGYRTRRYNTFMADQLQIPKERRTAYPQNVNSFDIKTSRKRWSLKAAYPPGLWMMDVMFVNKTIKYLILVEACSRYIICEPINDIEPDTNRILADSKGWTSPARFIEAFRRVIAQHPELEHRMHTIQSDADPAFTHASSQLFMKDLGVVWRAVPRIRAMAFPSFAELDNLHVKSEPNHTSLSIIDRAIRTIRDVAFNLRIGVLTPNEMVRVLLQINHAPNRRLRAVLGFDVSPSMAYNDLQLQEEVHRRYTVFNQLIYQSPGFMIPNGAHVQIYNESRPYAKRRELVQPQTYIVDSFNGALFTLHELGGDPEHTVKRPRWALKVLSLPTQKQWADQLSQSS